MKIIGLLILATLTASAQKAPKGFEFHTELQGGETLRGYIQRMEAMDIHFMDNDQTGIMQECHESPAGNRGVYECYDVPGAFAMCQKLNRDGTPGKWKRYKGHNYFNDCVRPFYPND